MAFTITKLPWYGQVGAFVGLAALAIGGFTYYYDMPAGAEMETREAQLKTLRADVQKGMASAKKLPEFKAEVENLEGRLQNLRAVLPEEKDAADLLRQMQSLATQSNLTIISFKPAPIVTKDLHAEWPINLELHGSYHNLALFMDRLGKFTRIVNISGLAVKGRDGKDKDPNTTVTATCVATTFVLLDKPATPPAKPGAKPGAKPAAAAAAAKKVA